MFFHDQKEVSSFLATLLQSDVMSFSVHCTKGLMVLICPITDDINLDLDHLVKAMSAGFL